VTVGARPVARHPDQVRASLWALVAFAFVAVITVALWLVAHRAARHQLAREMPLLAGQVGERIRACTETRVEMISQIRREWELGGIHDDAAFSSRIEALFATFPGYQAVNRIDDGVFSFVHPFESNRPALGRHLADTPAAGAALERAVAEGTPRLSAPIELFQAGTGFAVYVPTVKTAKGQMVLNGVFRSATLIPVCLGADDLAPYALSISDSGSSLFTREVPGEVAELAVTTTLPLFNRTWTLRMAPTQDRLDAELHSSQMIWLSGMPLSATIGLLVFALLTMRNRTRERARRVEARLQQAQRMESLGHLAAAVAHDFNNLLTVILASTFVISDRSQSKDITDAAKDIDDAAKRGAALTRELVTFGRGDASPERKVDLGAQVVTMKSMLSRLAGSAITLEVTTPEQPAFVLGSVVHIEQIIVNLVVNARAAMPDGGKLTVEVKAAGDHVTLCVSDTGVGIDPEVVPRIFEPFFSTKAPNEGTGLGLATVYGHVQRMKGEIRVETKLGAGTAFVLTFPTVA
jgi:signal transduction histidine kinase